MIDILIFAIIHGLIAIAVAIPMGTIHEYLHRRKATQLGYKVVRSSFAKNETVVDVTNEVHKKQIARVPYYYLIPLNLIIFIIGFYLFHIGIMVGSGATLMMHGISYPLEGREEKKRKD